MRLAGQVAIVTGAGSGIGRAIALRLAQEGSHIVIADIARRQAGDSGVAQGDPPSGGEPWVAERPPRRARETGDSRRQRRWQWRACSRKQQEAAVH